MEVAPPNPIPAPPGNPEDEKEAAEDEEVGVMRPPPTAELKSIRDGLPLPGAKEL